MDSDQIKNLRKVARLTQAQLAERVGVTQGHIADMERDRRIAQGPTLKLLEQIQSRYRRKLEAAE